jgi:hypothetical protein
VHFFVSCTFVLNQLNYFYFMFVLLCDCTMQMSMEQVSEVSKAHTEKELEKLRQHLARNPGELDLLVDKMREDGKTERSDLISRFATGRYPGVPYTMGADGEGLPGTSGGKMSVFVMVMYAVLAVLLLVAVLIPGVYLYEHYFDGPLTASQGL